MKLSHRMISTLHDLSRRHDCDTPGCKRFFSGWPTYDALRKRGMVEIRPDPQRKNSHWCVVVLADEGWRAIGQEPPPKLEPCVLEQGVQSTIEQLKAQSNA
jgi:hypothetical protein